jgi:hypothetical protein
LAWLRLKTVVLGRNYNPSINRLNFGVSLAVFGCGKRQYR